MSRQTEWQQKQIAAGRCPSCGNRNRSKHRRCTTCRLRLVTRVRKRREYQKVHGLCLRCGEPVGTTKQQHCDACRVVMSAAGAELRAERRATGLCISCGKRKRHPKSKAYCLHCLQQRRVKWRKRYGTKAYRAGKPGRPPLR